MENYQEKVKRLSELTAIARERELSPEETAERAALRREYIDSVTGSLKGHLENTTVIEKDGTKHKFGK